MLIEVADLLDCLPSADLLPEEMAAPELDCAEACIGEVAMAPWASGWG